MRYEFNTLFSLKDFIEATTEGNRKIYGANKALVAMLLAIVCIGVSFFAVFILINLIVRFFFVPLPDSTTLNFITIPITLITAMYIYNRWLCLWISKLLYSTGDGPLSQKMESTIVFDDEGMTIIEEHRQTKIDWAAFSKVAYTKNNIIFYARPLLYYISKSQFKSDEERNTFLGFCQAKILGKNSVS